MSDPKPEILLVEDNDITRTSLKTMFERSGYTVFEATTVVQAKALVDKASSLDAVITDYELAEGNGLEVIGYVLRVFPEAKKGIFTAFDELESNEKVSKFLNMTGLKGKIKFFYKPIESAAFLAWLRS